MKRGQFTVYVDPKHLDRLEDCAREADLPLATWAREILLVASGVSRLPDRANRAKRWHGAQVRKAKTNAEE